ncbi:hypothetical protein AB1N83_012387 [Pleurotus pulmonarius]
MSERLPIELIYHIIKSLDDRSDDGDSVERVGSISPALLACSLIQQGQSSNFLMRARFLSELRIRGIVKHDFHAPLLGQSLHPSALIIDISEDELNSPFPQGFACVGEFINALPFPGQLQKLTIKITREIQTWDRALRPTPADYEILSKVLDGLLKHGMLERVDLTIVISVLEDLDRQPPDGAAEVVNLEKAFGGLLKAGVLSSDIVIERKSGEVFRRWSVGQRVEA